FLGRASTRSATLSPDTAARVDEEVGRLVDEAAARAVAVIESHRGVLDAVVEALLEHETVEGDELVRLLAVADTQQDEAGDPMPGSDSGTHGAIGDEGATT
ncbi:MAG: hypothetical protein KGR17_06775, partial [Acidobacteria bacterium]|nr:hypothetical protein [Acidobacteriota bacterium]